jgi:multiple sugar transport system ATP-binding protein
MKDGVILQLASPEEIYNNPVNAYVAGFIGSPAMNLIPVHSDGAGLKAEDGAPIRAQAPRQGPLTLGIRAEDMQLCAESQANFSAAIYAFELLGDSTMATIKLGATSVAIKGDKHLRLQFGERVHVRFDAARLYWFDMDSGERVRPLGEH